MTTKKLLYIAAFLTLLTCVGHSVGTLPPPTPETETLAYAYNIMSATQVEMPMGSPRSLAQMAYGGNAFISLYLLMSGWLFLLVAKDVGANRKIILLNSASLAVAAVLSGVFYFPLPAICTGLAAALGVLATRKA